MTLDLNPLGIITKNCWLLVVSLFAVESRKAKLGRLDADVELVYEISLPETYFPSVPIYPRSAVPVKSGLATVASVAAKVIKLAAKVTGNWEFELFEVELLLETLLKANGKLDNEERSLLKLRLACKLVVISLEVEAYVELCSWLAEVELFEREFSALRLLFCPLFFTFAVSDWLALLSDLCEVLVACLLDLASFSLLLAKLNELSALSDSLNEWLKDSD